MKLLKKEKQLYCQLCEEIDCVHIGYVFGLPNVEEIKMKLTEDGM
jgi:hypothetical protein